MNCPKCNGATKVVDRRSVRRRRECLVCQTRFSTVEMLTTELPKKSTEKIQPIVSEEVSAPVAKPIKAKPKKPTSSISMSLVKRNATARNKIEDLMERKRMKDDFDFLDDDYNYLPESW